MILVVPFQAQYRVDGVVFGRGHGRGHVGHRPVLRTAERQTQRRDGRLVSSDEHLYVGPVVRRHLRGCRHRFTVAVAVRLHGTAVRIARVAAAGPIAYNNTRSCCLI